MTLPSPLRAALHHVARASIAHGLAHARALPVEPHTHDPLLRAPGAAFVTLRCAGRLRGCIGTLEAHRPLVRDVAENAWAAAFRDPRFDALSAAEAAYLDVHIAVLGPAEPLECRDEAELLAQLRPGIDGLILQEGGHRSTFLPSVWAELPEPRHFLAQLKAKAGLPADYWSASLEVSRYVTESF